LWGEVGQCGALTPQDGSSTLSRGEYNDMLLGEFVHVLDSKGRVTVPAKFRAELGTSLVVTRGIDRCLAVYPISKWEQLAGQVSELPLTDRQARAFRRLLFASAADVSPDGQGRILIPPPLREYAHLDGEVVVAGLSTHIELWDTEAWEGERERIEDVDPEINGWAVLGI